MGEQEQTLEEIFLELESIIEKMQQREVSLEDSFQLYEQGIQKLKQCNEKSRLCRKADAAVKWTGRVRAIGCRISGIQERTVWI